MDVATSRQARIPKCLLFLLKIKLLKLLWGKGVSKRRDGDHSGSQWSRALKAPSRRKQDSLTFYTAAYFMSGSTLLRT